MVTFTKEQAKTNLNGLIRKYNDNKQNKDFISNESQICESLIKPFVNLVLGYDTTEPSEFKVQTSMGGKRSDMLVCLNGVTQFIIEAKALNHDIKKDYQYYQQAIQYAQYKEKKFAILTNFKYFIVLDAEVEKEPLKSEVAVIEIDSLKNGEFDILWAFSKEVWQEKGETNEVLLKLKGKKKRKIDEQLLDDLKKWRLSLLNSLKNHPQKNKLDFDEDVGKIEEEVQKFIDRLVFVCYCEDKQLMDFELKSILNDKEQKYWDKEWYALDRARKLFEVYRKKYNSDLFNEDWCDNFYFDDNTLVKILKDLRQPKDKLPYDFSIIEADILGKTYENFIGHVLTGQKRLKEKESKGKRKSEGIYYTPAYIVDYIVKNTVKEYIKGKSIASINKVRILDPACGSGSFLIKSFDALIEECEKIRKLNYEEKKDLMLNCIFGVDKDERAVEICKLNLSLKLAERGQKLPEFHNNIKCGDSLIDDKNIAGDKAFNWNEKFELIMENGGFDIVIGNPPYVRSEVDNKEYQQQRKWMETSGKYETLYEKWDLFIAFIECGIKKLKEGGIFSFIISNSFNTSKFADKSKKFLLQNYHLKQVDFFKDIGVFKGVGVESVILLVQNMKRTEPIIRILHIRSFDNIIELPPSQDIEKIFRISKEINFSKKFESTELLGNICFISKGLVAHAEERKHKNEFTKDDLISNIPTKIHKKKYVEAKDISRYRINQIKYLEWDTKRSPTKLSRPTFPELYSHSKIIRGRTTGGVYDDQGLLCNESACVFVLFKSFKNIPNRSIDISIKKWNKKDRKELEVISSNFDLKYLLAILNSKFANFYLNTIRRHRIEFYFYSDDFKKLPIKNIPPEKQLPLINLCDKMLSFNKKLQKIGDKNTLEKQKIQEEIKKTDNEIDELVYQLYGITEQEKNIIEESLR